MNRINRVLIVIGLTGLLTLTSCSGASLSGLFNRRVTPAVPTDLSPKAQAQLRDFDFAVQSLRALYLKSDVVGQDWQKIVDAERERLVKSDGDEQQFVESLQRIVVELKDSDVALLDPPQPVVQQNGAPSPYSGIGVLVDLPKEGRDRILVLTVYSDSPADRAGLKPHDAIVAIEGEPVTFAARDELIPKLRGEAGSKVTVTVRTPGQAAREVTLTRRPVEPNSPIAYKRLPDTNIGYISPNPSDMTTMRSDTADALRDLSNDRNVDGVVLDLRVIRDNAGSAFPLDDMLSLFVNGQVGTVQARNAKEKIEIAGKSIAGSQEVPLAVMVSDQTSGQAEAFAGLLQDLGRAQVVGTQTPGNLAQITTMTLPSSRVQLQIPTGEYVGVKNNNWRGKGVTPNVKSEAAWEDFTAEDDPQLKQAVDAVTAQ
jgi:carboxyl-terminal processing protease